MIDCFFFEANCKTNRLFMMIMSKITVFSIIEKKIVELKYCPTNDMLADFMTKSLAKTLFEKFRHGLGIESV